MLIQQLFNLTDEQMELQLLDRLSFQRFVDLLDGSQVPDRTTIWTFKERLIAANAITSSGQMIDASIVSVPRQGMTPKESYFGYRLSASTDNRYKLIRRIVVSMASEHDTLLFEAALDPGNTARDVWADKGYVDP